MDALNSFYRKWILRFCTELCAEIRIKYINSFTFSAFGFGLAGCIGFGILLYRIYSKKTVFASRNILAGIILGIPNYFSIYLLIVSYKSTGWNDSTVLAIMNVSIVMIAALVGFIAFKENVTTRKILGLIAAITAIVLLYFAHLY